MLFNFIITVLVAYVVGLTIVHLVDKKLDKITIQLPAKWQQNNQRIIDNIEMWESSNRLFNQQDKAAVVEKMQTQAGEFDYDKIIKIAKEEKKEELKKLQQEQRQANISTNFVLAEPFVNPKCNIDIGNNNVNPAQDSFYSYQPINYPHPKTMTQGDLAVYKAKYHPHMTKQDYYNWLSMFKDDMDTLKKIGEIHIENMQRICKEKKPTEFQWEICRPDEVTPPQYVPQSVLYDKGAGTRYPHLACPFMSYDIRKVVGYNYGKYSEFS